MKAFVVVGVITAIGLSGCALKEFEDRSRGDFDRHNQSHLEVSRTDESILIFEAKAEVGYPIDSETAEAERMEWLEGWLEREDYCPDGHEILSRRKLGAGDINFHDMDLRYEVRCSEAPPEASPEAPPEEPDKQ